MLAPPDPPLTDGVVDLRPVEEEDLESLEKAIDDPEINAWFGPMTISAQELLANYGEGWRKGTAASFGVCAGPGGFAGLVALYLREGGKADVGFWMLPLARRRGHASRAVRLLSQWALGDAGVARLQVFTDPHNHAAQRVAERSGFHREGLLRSYADVAGHRRDLVLFSLLPSDLPELAIAPHEAS